MVGMCMRCGRVPPDFSEARDAVEYSVLCVPGARMLCTGCLAAVNDAWINTSRPKLGRTNSKGVTMVLSV